MQGHFFFYLIGNNRSNCTIFVTRFANKNFTLKQSTQLKTLAFIWFALSTSIVAAQGRSLSSNDAVQIDTLTKLIGLVIAVGGFFMGYMQMRMAIKVAELEAKMHTALTDIKKEFQLVLDKEVDKLDDKIKLSTKDIETRMATRHDIDNMKTQLKMQHEIQNMQMEGIKEQLKSAALTYKKDNN